MSFLYETRTYPSEKNGQIRCSRVLGTWSVSAGGNGQTTPYTNRMWKLALNRVPKKGIKRVLMLGLGAGGTIELLHQRFKNCKVTVIEWDPVMVQIAQELGFITKHPPQIILGDALQELPKLQENYDLILIDLFQGLKVASAVHQEAFLKAFPARLSRDGYLILNVFREPELRDIFNTVLSCHSKWRFQSNYLGLYRRYGLGKAGDPLPKGYISHHQSQEYLRCGWGFIPMHNIQVLGEKGWYGARWKFGPFTFERYETDEEPHILKGPARIITWQRLSRLDIPKGWIQPWIRMGPLRTGFAEIGDKNSYWNSWSEHAKRHQNKWLKSKPYQIEETQNLEEFIKSYQAVPKLRFLKTNFIHTLRERKECQKDATHLFVARNQQGSVVAGLAVIDLKDINQSTHLMSFIHPQAESTSVGVGLIDHWFQHAISQNIRFLNFGVFWSPGDLQSWKGFSRFKSQFGIFFVHRPKPLIRFVGTS